MVPRSEQPPSREELTTAIHEVLARYLEKEVSSVLELNNGLCDDFAGDVLIHLNRWESDGFFVIGYDGVDMHDPVWMSQFWPGSKPPPGLQWHDLVSLEMYETSHVWLALHDRHYDADVPEGVDNMFDLPVFRRNLVLALRNQRPEFLKAQAHDPWWQESVRLHEEYRQWCIAQAEERHAEPRFDGNSIFPS